MASALQTPKAYELLSEFGRTLEGVALDLGRPAEELICHPEVEAVERGIREAARATLALPGNFVRGLEIRKMTDGELAPVMIHPQLLDGLQRRMRAALEAIRAEVRSQPLAS